MMMPVFLPSKAHVLVLTWILLTVSSASTSFMKERDCPGQFTKVCPDSNVTTGELGCIVELYKANKLGSSVGKKCAMYALGIYQNSRHLPDDENSIGINRKFNEPSECSAWNTHEYWALSDTEKKTKSAVNSIDFTLVSQCSADRLWMVGELCKVTGQHTNCLVFF
jgi:hypothetical protein